MRNKLEKLKLYFIFLLGRFMKGSNEKDKKYLGILYKFCMKKKCDFENPITYNEKLQWLKLYDRKDIYTSMVDKYKVKKIVEDIIGEQFVIKTLGVWNNFESIDFESLPKSFILKCTHDSGGIVICKDKSKLNMQKTKKIINHCLKRNYFLNHREWPYKNVVPRIIAEEYLVDESGKELKDYKFFCFNGKAKLLYVASDRMHDTKFDFYDLNFKHVNIINTHPNSSNNFKKPKNFEKMIQLAEELSKNIPHVRIDLYNINGIIKFGEMTFYHNSGLVPFEPEQWDYQLGQWLKLPSKKENEK